MGSGVRRELLPILRAGQGGVHGQLASWRPEGIGTGHRGPRAEETIRGVPAAQRGAVPSTRHPLERSPVRLRNAPAKLKPRQGMQPVMAEVCIGKDSGECQGPIVADLLFQLKRGNKNIGRPKKFPLCITHSIKGGVYTWLAHTGE